MKKLLPLLLILSLTATLLLSCTQDTPTTETTVAAGPAPLTTTEAPATTTPEPTEPPTTKAPPTYTVVKEYKFTDGLGDWKGNAQFKDIKAEDGVLKFTSTGGDPSIALKSPLNMDASEIDLIRVEVKNMTANDQFQLFFTTDTLTTLDEPKSYKDILSYTESDPASDEWYTATVYTDEVDEWEGTIKAIRIDPVNAEGDVWIRSITFLKQESE